MKEENLVFKNYKPRSRCFMASEESITKFQKVLLKIQEEKIDCELNDMVPLERDYNFDIKRDFEYITRDLELKNEEAILKLANVK
ncbi:unnamed protein product [Cryptosporidium hominis]|uniref:Uncharacterized protein n=1 Tax=Cryptosporidium hominis TaxID=237895 RepID=A0A0S4TID4_CRYHO|nr:hypothetical protein ChTU502y2012_407g0775 [Cryptosporidium hominis]PPA64212.1 hypothetical protein ChUKH1_05360 [Cryptosporidium hominis]PPS94849.1 Uncharacterized protein GY17_00001947 [Cryptosporidium hominis]CUV07137.1 unnamed protein product [Cryptosporidium hominis]|eukprot:PPS94849.1 Uncharacterized protein GY17_00001947 [Cryptosporidium hominis]